MLKKDLLKLVENAKDDEDIDSLVENSDLAKSLQTKGLTLDAFKGKLNEREFKAFIDAEKDTHHKKALKTMKEKGTWESEFGDVLKEKYPELIKDPLQVELIKERKAREELEAKLARKDLLAEAMKYAKDKKLPASIIEKCLAEDFEKTKESIDTIAKEWADGLEAIATEKLKKGSYVPGGTDSDGNKLSIGASIAAAVNANKSSVVNDPWASK